MRSMKKRGIALIEYALILAFIAVVGVVFVGNNGMKNPVLSIFDSAVVALGGPYPNNYEGKFSYKTNIYPQKYMDAMEFVASQLYGKFNIDGKKLGSVQWDNDGKLVQVSYYTNDNPKDTTAYQTLEGSDILNTYGVDSVTDLFSKTDGLQPQLSGYVAFNRDGDVISQLNGQGEEIPGRPDLKEKIGYQYTHINLKSDNPNYKYIQFEIGSGDADGKENFKNKVEKVPGSAQTKNYHYGSISGQFE